MLVLIRDVNATQKKTFYDSLLTCSYWRRINKIRSIFLLRICILVNNFNNILDIAVQLGADFINDFQRNRFVLTQLRQSCITNSHQISEFNLSHITLDELVPQGLVRNRHGKRTIVIPDMLVAELKEYVDSLYGVNEHLDMLVKTSGLTKQEYIIKRLTCEEIIVHPNIRVQKYLSAYLVELTKQLQRLERLEQKDDVLGNIQYLLELISKMSPEPVR